jgi:hypothetical protein
VKALFRFAYVIALHGFAIWGVMDAIDRVMGLGWRI